MLQGRVLVPRYARPAPGLGPGRGGCPACGGRGHRPSSSRRGWSGTSRTPLAFGLVLTPRRRSPTRSLHRSGMGLGPGAPTEAHRTASGPGQEFGREQVCGCLRRSGPQPTCLSRHAQGWASPSPGSSSLPCGASWSKSGIRAGPPQSSSPTPGPDSPAVWPGGTGLTWS